MDVAVPGVVEGGLKAGLKFGHLEKWAASLWGDGAFLGQAWQ